MGVIGRGEWDLWVMEIMLALQFIMRGSKGLEMRVVEVDVQAMGAKDQGLEAVRGRCLQEGMETDIETGAEIGMLKMVRLGSRAGLVLETSGETEGKVTDAAAQ